MSDGDNTALEALRYGEIATREPAAKVLEDRVTNPAAEALKADSQNGSNSKCPAGERMISDESQFVEEVPKIMRNKGWNVAADFQDFWINGPENQLVGKQSDGKGSKRDLEIASISFDWVLRFARAMEHYKLMQSEAVYANAAARDLLRDRIETQYKATKQKQIAFGDFTTSELGRETQYVNQRALGTSQGGTGSLYSTNGFTLDELVGALGRFAMFVIAKGVGTVNPPDVSIQINEIGIYIRDSFDFNDDQPLGAWKKPDQIDIIPDPNVQFPTCSDQTINMSNWAYRQYRKRTRKGRDFLIYSEIKVTKVNTQFTAKLKN